MTKTAPPVAPAYHDLAEPQGINTGSAAPGRREIRNSLTTDLIRAWANHDPGRVALWSDDGQCISYSQLISQIDAIRATLNSLGCGRGDRIALVHPSDARHVILSLGIASGMAVLPFNPAATEEELTREFQIRGVHVLLNATGTGDAARSAAGHLGIPVIDVTWHEKTMTSGFTMTGGRERPTEHPGPVQEDDITLVLATSGTTSRNKVVPLRERNLLVRQWVSSKRLQPGDRGLCMVPLYLSTGMVNAATCLRVGISTILMPVITTDAFFRAFDRLRPTFLQASPAFLTAILAEIDQGRQTVNTDQLRFIRPASGRISRSDLEALERYFSCTVIEGYGLTETGMIACNPFPPAQRKPGTVGLPLDCEIVIRDDDGQALAVGRIGEVSARRDDIFDGYEDDLEATRAVYRNGWFYTGDLGYLDEDGYLTLAGRIKELINRGGEKISPLEVDAALQAHPRVADAAAFAIPHPTLGEIVGAALVLEIGQQVSKADMVAFLRPKLSPIKMPRDYLFTDRIPRGDYGKILRQQLTDQMAQK